MQPSGYKLIEIETGNEVQSWGGTYGVLTDPPNPLTLPNGDNVCGAEVDGEYSGYKLVLWMMDEPPPPVPESITRRQCALQLRALGLITGSEAVAMTRDGTPPAYIQGYFNTLEDEDRITAEIDFAATSYFRANSLIGALLTANGMTEADADAFFLAAAEL